MFMILYRKRYTLLNVEGHQDGVKGEILRWPTHPCYLNKEKCNLNQTKDDRFVESVAKNNSWNNGVCHRVHKIFLQSVSWSLAEFRHNKIVQSPHENFFKVCRQHKEKWDLVKMTIIQTGW